MVHPGAQPNNDGGIVVHDQDTSPHAVTSRVGARAAAPPGDRCVVEVTSNGREALSKLEASTYDATTVLDIRMSPIDGYEVARRVRGPNRRTPMIMVTAVTERNSRVRGFAEGVGLFLPKPFTAAAFRSAFRSLLG